MKPSVNRLDMDPLSTLANWYECLHGRQPFEMGLQQLAKDFGAWGVCLSRHSRELMRAAQVLTSDEPDIKASLVDVDRSYAHCVLGIYIDRPRVGSVWLSSAVQEGINPRLQEFQAKHKISELAVIPLAVGDKQIDYLEIHFACLLSDAAVAPLNALADALSRAWASRRPGLYAESAATTASKSQVGSAPKYLLSRENPYGLTRSEFRVCILLQRGLNTKSICSELMISYATLRSHLRSVYRKTCTKSLNDLASTLLMQPQISFDQEAHRLRRTG